MIKKLLSAHPRILVSDKTLALSRIRKLINHLVPSNDAVAQKALLLTRDQTKHLRAEYWKYITSLASDIESPSLFIDIKSNNCQDLELINVLFPEARVIMALRDPRDICLSSFLQSFITNKQPAEIPDWNSVLLRQTGIISHYQSLRNHLACRILELKYEEIVNDPEALLRRVLRFIGETWSYRIILNTHNIHTQYQHTISRWQNYPDFFESDNEALASAVEKSGYSIWTNQTSIKIA